MGIFLIVCIVLWVVFLVIAFNGGDLWGISCFSTTFSVLCLFVFIMLYGGNIQTISEMEAYYDVNQNIQDKIVKEFNKLAVVDKKYSDNTLVNVDNMQQSIQTSEVIKKYMKDVTDYNTMLVYYRKAREKNIMSFIIFGPLPKVPEHLKTIDINFEKGE